MALNRGNFITALYLAQVASDNYDCLREDCRLKWYDIFGWKRQQNVPFQVLIEGTAMTRLMFGLRRGIGDACSLLDIESVPGVDWDELFDRNGFSELHKIVHGISSQPLDAEIEARPENLDRPDSIGLTALWYACWLGNSNHVRTMIRHGADVNNASVSPICAAVWRGSYDSVEQLLNAGAFIRDRSIDILYQTLVHRPSHRKDVKEILAIDKALFGRILNINYRSFIHKYPTVLIALVWRKCSHSLPRMRQLLELGADVELCDRLGVTPLHHAIFVGNAEGCKILGRAGANVSVQDQLCGTILHTAIRNATHPDIIQAVSELDLSGIELGAKDGSGYTAFEILQIRAGERRNDQHVPIARLYPLHRFKLPGWYFYKHFKEAYVLFSSGEDIYPELQILSLLQNLLQQVQEAQGVPVEDRYPLLTLTREFPMVDDNEDSPLEPVTPVMPGAWPER